MNWERFEIFPPLFLFFIAVWVFIWLTEKYEKQLKWFADHILPLMVIATAVLFLIATVIGTIHFIARIL